MCTTHNSGILSAHNLQYCRALRCNTNRGNICCAINPRVLCSDPFSTRKINRHTLCNREKKGFIGDMCLSLRTCDADQSVNIPLCAHRLRMRVTQRFTVDGQGLVEVHHRTGVLACNIKDSTHGLDPTQIQDPRYAMLQTLNTPRERYAFEFMQARAPLSRHHTIDYHAFFSQPGWRRFNQKQPRKKAKQATQRFGHH